MVIFNSYVKLPEGIYDTLCVYIYIIYIYVSTIFRQTPKCRFWHKRQDSTRLLSPDGYMSTTSAAACTHAPYKDMEDFNNGDTGIPQ